jgi:hypothetical protein
MAFCEHAFDAFDYVKVGEFMNISLSVSAQFEVCSV